VRHDGRPLRRLIAAACLVAACGGRTAPGPALQITGESTKIRRGDRLPATSASFDGATVRLRAARGETLGVTVWVTGHAAVGLALDDATVRGYRVTYQQVRRPSTRMYGPSAGAGAWPDRLVPAEAPVIDADGAAFFELEVPATATAGLHRGVVRVDARAIPIELTVDDVTMPSITEAPRVWAYVDEAEVDRTATGGVLAWSRAMRRLGVAAAPDLRVDDWDRDAEMVRGLPWVPVRLPDDPAAWDGDIRTWVARLAGTGRRPFAIPIDEPHGDAAKAEVRARAAQVRAAGAGAFLYAVTDAPDPAYGDLVDLYISPLAVTLAAPDPAHRWTYNGAPPYAGSMILDTDGAALRTWGWIGWRWQVPLWYVWDSAYWRDRYGARRSGVPSDHVDPARDSVTFDDGEDHGNLDGVLAWSDERGFVPTLRLAALRRGLQDRALLELLERCAGRAAAEAIAAPMVPTALGDVGGDGFQSRPGSWPTDEASWEAARFRILDALESDRACVP
jgi:hypothetical protein